MSSTVCVTEAVECRDGSSLVKGDGPPEFTLVFKSREQFDWFQRADLYSTALAFIRGDFEIRGDIVAAIRAKTERARHGLRDLLASVLARFSAESWFQTRGRAARNIRFHYDRSNEFYKQFLDRRMLYSSADFSDPRATLEDAQLAKLDHICRKLDLHAGDRFLDIGCGWGALVVHAAEAYGATSMGCTLSLQQAEIARQRTSEHGVEGRVSIHELDYRAVEGKFDKIASIGMFEHVGRRRLAAYFRKVFSLLEDEGLFLNRGIIRPEPVTDGPETLVLQKKIFPGGELPHLSAVAREAEMAGFQILEVRSIRPHYGLTCRHWVERLQKNVEECLKSVSAETYRAWLLYLAGSAVSFESGVTDVCQILMAKRSSAQALRLDRV